MAINFTDRFTKLGKLFGSADDLLTALTTTLPANLKEFTDLFSGETVAVQSATDGLYTSQKEAQQLASQFISGALRTSAETLILEAVRASTAKPINNIDEAIDELITQFEDNTEDLDVSAVTATYAVIAATGTGKIIASTKNTEGKTNEFIFAEIVNAKVLSASTDGSAILDMRGDEFVSDPSSVDWPGGSGAIFSINSYVGASGQNLITNGDFATVDDIEANLPEDWIATTATMGTTLKLSSIEVQTITISGTPTTGKYRILWTDAAGDNFTTEPIAYNDDGSGLETSLQEIPGLSEVTVATTGTTPNFTHTVTMTGVTNPAQFTSTQNFDTGSIAHATSTAATANSVRGVRSVEFDSNGAELTTIMFPVALAANTVYHSSVMMKVDSAPAAGVMTVDLVDGVGGTVVNDDAGTANSYTIAITGLTTTFTLHTGAFITPKNTLPTLYYRIRISTAISNTSSVFLDEAILVPAVELYTGGIWVSGITGPIAWQVGDTSKVTTTNNRGGEMHEWLDRLFGLRQRNKLFPTATAPASQPDTLIS